MLCTFPLLAYLYWRNNSWFSIYQLLIQDCRRKTGQNQDKNEGKPEFLFTFLPYPGIWNIEEYKAREGGGGGRLSFIIFRTQGCLIPPPPFHLYFSQYSKTKYIKLVFVKTPEYWINSVCLNFKYLITLFQELKLFWKWI